MSDTEDNVYESDLVREIFEGVAVWEARFGIELKSLLDPDHYSFHDARRLVRERLIEGIGRYQGFPAEEAGPAPAIRLGANPVAEMPVMFTNQDNVKTIAQYRGDDVVRYVKKVNASLNLMGSSQNVGELVGYSLGTGILVVGFQVALAVRKLMKVPGTLFKTALKDALVSTGLKTAVGIILILALEIALWAIFSRRSKILGLLVNDTDVDFVVTNWLDGTTGYKTGDLYMTHGSLKAFPVSHMTDKLDSPEVQLNARFVDDDGVTMVGTSLFYAEANAGFRGAEGVFVFTDRLKQQPGFSVQFAVPYSRGNGVNIESFVNPNGGFTNKDAIDKYFRAMYDQRNTHVEKTDKTGTYGATINSANGQECCCIAIVQRPGT